MRIIRHGIIMPQEGKPQTFVCTRCGCMFEADPQEYSTTILSYNICQLVNDHREVARVCVCPDCGYKCVCHLHSEDGV